MKKPRPLPRKHGLRVTRVEIDEGPPCPACGTIGPHFCTGGQPQGGGWVGVRKKAAKSDKNIFDKADSGA